MVIRFLRHAFGVGILVAGSFLCPEFSVQAASPDMPAYPWDLKKRMPVHYQAYLKILPAWLKRTAWFGRFDGTGMPIDQVTIDGRVYISGGMCKPHECGDNFLTFLIEADGSRAVAMVKAREAGGQIVELGNPTAAERQFMAKEFQD